MTSSPDALRGALGDLRHPEYLGRVPKGIWQGGRVLYWRRGLHALYCRFEPLMPIERDPALTVALNASVSSLPPPAAADPRSPLASARRAP